ncbi:BMP family lipoprotein [Naasia lichenicola]|nr:BMP family ABC transporter substrate-binding protein [Naasia lichenicola]
MKRNVILGTAVIGLLLAVSGCAGTPSAPAADSSEDASAFKVGLVSDSGGFNDRGFNALSLAGLTLAEDAGVSFTSEARESASDSDLVPNLQYFAQQGYDLIIAVGFAQAGPVAEVAADYPDVDFAIVDVATEGDPALEDLDNVQGITFKEQEGAYLAGVLVGGLRASGFEKFDGDAIGTVGGEKQPSVDRFIAGFQQGIISQSPDTVLLNGYSQTFADQDACKQLANAQLDQGADAIFAVAGGCGLGALDAADQAGAWGIGVDADQAFLGDFILTSVVKKVDVAVSTVLKSFADGSFEGGTDVLYGIENDGVGIPAMSDAVPADVQAAVEAARAGIIDGSVVIDLTIK